MSSGTLRVAVVGTGSWAQRAHLPAWRRDGRAEVVALADTNTDALAQAAARFGIGRTVADYRDLLDDPDIDVVDVVTGNRPHFEISRAALEAGKHVLCEKPVHTDYRMTRQAAELAAAKGLKTKVGFTFRYAPAIQFARHLMDDGYVGEPYIFNGFEQNSQWIDPATPLRQVDPDADPDRIAVSSIEGYGAPIIDIMHWWLGAPLQAVVGAMRNFVPVRMVRDTGRMTRANIDDGDMWIAEFGSGVEDVGPMLQALLIERFKMKTHFEDRPVTAYTLISVKPKLKKADPSTRTNCTVGNGPTMTTVESFRLPSRQVTCQNITMAQFVDQLQILAGTNYLRYPVLDATGLDGAWDFSFTFSPIAANQLAGLRGAPPPAAAGAAAPGASDPIGGNSFFDAVEKQLGLKLEEKKRTYPVLVIDHIEEKPTEN